MVKIITLNKDGLLEEQIIKPLNNTIESIDNATDKKKLVEFFRSKIKNKGNYLYWKNITIIKTSDNKYIVIWAYINGDVLNKHMVNYNIDNELYSFYEDVLFVGLSEYDNNEGILMKNLINLEINEINDLLNTFKIDKIDKSDKTENKKIKKVIQENNKNNKENTKENNKENKENTKKKRKNSEIESEINSVIDEVEDESSEEEFEEEEFEEPEEEEEELPDEMYGDETDVQYNNQYNYVQEIEEEYDNIESLLNTELDFEEYNYPAELGIVLI